MREHDENVNFGAIPARPPGRAARGRRRPRARVPPALSACPAPRHVTPGGRRAGGARSAPVSQRVTSARRRRCRRGPPARGSELGAAVRARTASAPAARRPRHTARAAAGGGGLRGERSGEERPAPAPGVGRGGGTCRWC